MALRSFACAETEAVFETGRSRRFGNVLTVLRRKLFMLHNASKLADLIAPPANREDVECVDYH
jgi:proteic killer suppression protein